MCPSWLWYSVTLRALKKRIILCYNKPRCHLSIVSRFFPLNSRLCEEILIMWLCFSWPSFSSFVCVSLCDTVAFTRGLFLRRDVHVRTVSNEPVIYANMQFLADFFFSRSHWSFFLCSVADWFFWLPIGYVLLRYFSFNRLLWFSNWEMSRTALTSLITGNNYCILILLTWVFVSKSAIGFKFSLHSMRRLHGDSQVLSYAVFFMVLSSEGLMGVPGKWLRVTLFHLRLCSNAQKLYDCRPFLTQEWPLVF